MPGPDLRQEPRQKHRLAAKPDCGGSAFAATVFAHSETRPMAGGRWANAGVAGQTPAWVGRRRRGWEVWRFDLSRSTAANGWGLGGMIYSLICCNRRRFEFGVLVNGGLNGLASGFVSITDRRFECSKVGVNGLAGLNFPRKQIFPWNARFGTTLEVCVEDHGNFM